MSLVTRPASSPNAAEQQIQRSMAQLLRCAGLEYQGGYVEADGHRIHYLEYGEGPPVLLLHGGGAGSAIWYRQIAALSKSFRVIAPDNPVFGLSSQSPFPRPLPESVARFLVTLMDAFGIERASFAGLSMGGFGALALAMAAPERVDKLVAIDAAGLGSDLPWIFRLITLPILGHVITRPNKWAQDRFFETLEAVNTNQPDVECFKQYAYDVTTSLGHSSALRTSVCTVATLQGQRNVFTDEDLKSIRAETMLIWGDRDRFFPVSHGERAHRLIPNSALHVLESAGHVAIWDQAERVNELLLGFLEPSGRRTETQPPLPPAHSAR